METSTAKPSMGKADIVALVVDKGLLDHEIASAMTKPQLMVILGKPSDNTKTSAQPVTMIDGKRLFPQGIVFADDHLYLFDGATTGIWQVHITSRSGKYTGKPTLLLNLPAVKAVAKLAVNPNYLYVASPEAGLLRIDKKQWLVTTITNSGVAGVCTYTDGAFFTTSSHLVKQISNENMEPSVVSGTNSPTQKLTSRDGFSARATHAQPGQVMMVGKSLVVCDNASVSIRLITNIDCLLSYHQTIAKLYQAFAIHSDKLGYRNQLESDVVMTNLKDVCSVFDKMLEEVREGTGNPTLKPNGPHGSLPYITIVMFNDLCQNMQDLYKLVATYQPAYTINTQSLLSVPCEHHFATMRSRYPMPSMLQYCELLNTVVDETLKRMTNTSYHYYTGKDFFYPKPELLGVELCQPHRAVEVVSRKLTPKQRCLMLNWRKDFCGGKLS